MWWSGSVWRAEAEQWIRDRLAADGIRVTGQVAQPRVRFWSTQLRVPTDAGTFWFKENSPTQSFEAGLLATLAHLTPEQVVTPIAVEPSRGWLLSPDAGPTLQAVGGGSESDWTRIVREFAQFQRVLAPHRAELLGTGLAAHAAADAVTLVRTELAHLMALPEKDALRPDPAQAEAIEADLPRLAEAAEVLTATKVADSLQHNDLHAGNAFPPAAGALRFFDFGDALWSHPFASLMVPIDVLRRAGTAEPVLRRVRDAYLEVFTDLQPRAELLATVEAAVRVGAVHRYISWRRLVTYAVGAERAHWGPRTVWWLTRATAPDPTPPD